MEKILEEARWREEGRGCERGDSRGRRRERNRGRWRGTQDPPDLNV